MNLTVLLFILCFLNCTNPKTLPSVTEKTQLQAEKASPDFSAKVIRIIDGDTLEVLYGELPVMIRLAHIDCPEKRGKQPFGNKAKQALSNLCFGQNVEIKYDSKDRNGRYICVIFNEDGLNVNKEMIRLGLAWHYKKYSSNQEYAELEKEARNSKIGLWSDPNPVPPWEWRK